MSIDTGVTKNQNISLPRVTAAPIMSMGSNTPGRANTYQQMAESMGSRANLGDLSMSMKNAGVGPTSKFGSSMGQTPLKLGMKFGASRNTARSSNLSMNASFNVSGSLSNNKVIDNYQDMSIGASRRTVTGGWTNGAHVNAFGKKHGRTSRLVMMATPEGSWGDVKR